MKAVGFFNNKGGVGKTTLLCNVASYLSLHHNKRILVIDADPQANASQLMLPEKEFESFFADGKNKFTINTITQPLSSGKGFTQSFDPVSSPYYGVDLIVGDSRLALVEDILAQDWSQSSKVRGMRTTLMFRQMLSWAKDYDLVFFDMSPSLGAINRSVLLACDAFILPMSTDIFSLRATENIAVWLSRWKKDFIKNASDFDIDERSEIEVQDLTWRLSLLGYVTQQYNQKATRGVKRPVKSYESIISRVPEKIESTLTVELGGEPLQKDYFLGTVPHLFSLIPMSQIASKPIHQLKAEDGIVGSHFTRVKAARDFFGKVSGRVLENLEHIS